MKHIARRVTVATTAFAASLLLPAIAAAAAAPAKGPVEVIPYEFSVDCGPYGFAFDNNVQGEETVWVQTFFDTAGNPIKQVTHDSFSETDTNSVSGKVLRVSGRQVETLDFLASTRTVVGKHFLVTDPGAGLVVQDAGRVVFDPPPFHVAFEAGHHDGLHGNVDELVCNALARVGLAWIRQRNSQLRQQCADLHLPYMDVGEPGFEAMMTEARRLLLGRG
jgi:hypothetical protein